MVEEAHAPRNLVLITPSWSRRLRKNDFKKNLASYLSCTRLFLANGRPSLAQEKTKLAEGEYTITTGKPQSVGKALDHWTIWKVKDHNLQVQTRLEGPGGNARQEFLFTPDLKSLGYSVYLFEKGEAGEKDHRLSLSCQLLPERIKCKEEMRGQEELKDAFELSVNESQ
jgi:hypothetical protein